MKKKIISKWEWLGLVIFFLFFTITFSLMTKVNWMNGQGDSAIFVDITENIVKFGLPKSNLVSSVIELQSGDKNLLSVKADKIEEISLVKTQYKDTNVFKFHFYPIIYLIAPFSWFVSAENVWSILTALSFLGMLFLLYIFLRSKGLSIISSGLFCLLISSHPAWNYSVQWQIYPDRLFVFLGLLLAITIDREKPKIGRLIVMTLLCSFIVEKMAIITGLFIVGYVVLYGKRFSLNSRYKIGVLGVLVLVFAFLIIKLYLDNFYYSSFISLSNFTNFFNNLKTNKVVLQNLTVFGMFNLVPLLFLGVFEWRASLLALGVMIPNIVGSIGGAEKTGWLSHYHSTYFPILVWALAKGYLGVNKKIKSIVGKLLIGILLVLVMLLSWGTDPFSLERMVFSKITISKNAWNQSVERCRDYFFKLGYYSYLNNRNKMIDQAIPKNVMVSAKEDLWIPLFKGREINYFPLALDSADYVVIRSYSKDKEGPVFQGFTSYLSADNASAADDILRKRMRKLGFDVLNPIIIDGNVAIIKRLKK